MIKSLNKVSIKGMFLNITKTICDKSTANGILNSEKLKAFYNRNGTLVKSVFNIMIHINRISCRTLMSNWKEISQKLSFRE